MTEKFTAVPDVAAMTAAYFAKHKCSECKFSFYWRAYLACGIRKGAVDHPFLLWNKEHRACNKFRNKEQSK